MNKGIFPQIYLPNYYKQILNSKPEEPLKPNEPKNPLEPTKPDYNKESSGLGCFFLPLLILSVILLFMGINDGIEFKGWLISIGELVFSSAYFIISFQNKIKRKKSIPELEKNYKQELIAYQEKLKELTKERKEYQKRLDKYNNQIKKLQTPEVIRDYRFELFKRSELDIQIEKNTTELIKNGASEDLFFNLLFKKYGPKIQKSIAFSHKQYYLYPDICYLDSDNKLYIDIEIDEPYSGNNGDPIHFIDSNDVWRNKVFTDQNWVVIRFAEEQIIRQPNESVKFLESFIKYYLNLKITEPEKFISNSSIKKIPVWSRDEAHRMAFRRYRLSYLPKKLHSKIKDENFSNKQSIEDEVINNWKIKNIKEEFDDLPF